jgi:hypothetical protein
MRKATAIYHAPEGDAKSTTINGVIFNDGETVDLNSNDHPHLMVSKLENNQHFEFTRARRADDKPRRGRRRVRKPATSRLASKRPAITTSSRSTQSAVALAGPKAQADPNPKA